MFSIEGKRLVNQVLAKREATLGSHIVLGLNIVYDADLTGLNYPRTHNRYHSPYVIDEIPITNSSVLTAENNERDRIVFSGQASGVVKYTANNMALAVVRNKGVRTRRTVASVANGTNWSGHTIVTAPATVFTNDGVLGLVTANTATYTGRIDISGYGEDDIVAFPLSFHGASVPTGAQVSLVFDFTDGGVAKTCTYTGTITVANNLYKFNWDTTRNNVSGIGTDTAPVPFVFQQRLKSGAGWTSNNFKSNLANITGVRVILTNSTNTIRFGTITLTPDFESDTSRITTAFRKLNSVLYKTDQEAYVNPEFTLLGVVI